MPSTSILMRSMEAIQTGIQGLGLSGLTSTNVLIHKVPRDHVRDLAASNPLPCVIISPRDAETLNPMAGTNVRDDVIYPIQVAIFAQDSQSQTADFDKYLLWRESIRRTFHNSRLSGITEVLRVTVQPKVIIDQEAWLKGYFISALMLMVTSRESRL